MKVSWDDDQHLGKEEVIHLTYPDSEFTDSVKDHVDGSMPDYQDHKFSSKESPNVIIIIPTTS